MLTFPCRRASINHDMKRKTCSPWPCFVLVADDALQKVSCTACGRQVNQFQRNSVYEHPALKVLICKVGKFRSPS